MEAGDIRIVRRLWELFNALPVDPKERKASPELAELLDLFDPEVEFHQGGPQADADDFKGRRELSTIWADWLGTWTDHKSEVEEIRAGREGRFLVLSREHFRGRDGLAVETEGASIVTVADGRITRLESYVSDRAGALEIFAGDG